MQDWANLERRLSDTLALPRRPVAVSFGDAPPADVPKLEGSQPAGCSFWRLAAQGRSFYTVPADHANCAIGSYTHNMPLPAEREAELGQTLGFMTEIGYLKMEEVPGIPQLPTTPAVVVYAPLGDVSAEPDLVLLAGRPGKLMLLQEAALRAGILSALPMLARPTCMALPAALTSGVVLSSGCVGNRVYTELGEDELYVAVPGRDLDRLVDALDGIVAANAKLATYHGERRAALATE